MLKYLGLDYSLNATGYVVIDECFKIRDKGVIRVKKLRNGERLCFLFKKFNDLVRKNKYAFQAVGMEGYSFMSKGKVFNIGEGGGVLKLVLETWRKETGRNWYEFQPTSVKKFVTGSGNAEKNLIMKFVYKKWKYDIDDDDIADACVVTRLTQAFDRFIREGSTGIKDLNLKEYQIEQLKKLVTKVLK